MKQLSVQSQKVLQQFERWLKVQGYSKSVYYASYHRIQELIVFHQQTNSGGIKSIKKKVISEFFDYQKSRVSDRTNRRISSYHLNDYIFSIKRFSRFCQKYYEVTIPIEHIRLEPIAKETKVPLTLQEIQLLFNATHPTDRLGYRDRCMLALYYGCGLRRNEGLHVYLNDICFTRNQIHVREGKGGKQRIVPFTQSTRYHLKEYVYKGRPLLQCKHKTRKVLLLNERGQPIQAQSLNNRLKKLVKQSGINRKIGIHHLRHSIATHLLDNNMPIDQIAKFLGHSSLESTQIYTHVTIQV